MHEVKRVFHDALNCEERLCRGTVVLCIAVIRARTMRRGRASKGPSPRIHEVLVRCRPDRDVAVTDTAARAQRRVELVRDNTAERLALAQDFYHADPGRFRRYGHAELSFMRWSAARGVLEPESSDPVGSAWWRSVNEMLLRDKVEAGLLATDTSGNASNRNVQYWLEFIRQPSPTRWYRAHNASIVAGYLTYEGLAAQEIKVERFMMNVALIRVLYTHAMLANPRLALGPLAFLGPRLVDPRHRSVKSFLDLGRSFPRSTRCQVPSRKSSSPSMPSPACSTTA